MRHTILGAILVFLFGTAAFSQTPCSTYTIRADDSLREISNEAYGNGSLAQLIYDANKTIIGSDPARLAPGLVINIPCADGTISETDFVPYVIPEEDGRQNNTAAFLPFQKPIRIAVNSDFAPFSGSNLVDGGMIPELVSRAVSIEDPEREINLVYVEGLDTDLQDVFDQGRFDLALPIFLPNCRQLGLLREADRNLCRNYYASRPLYEVIIGMYALNTSYFLQAESFEDLTRSRMCRPENDVDFDLRQGGLEALQITFVRLPSVEDCVAAILDGSVDLMSVNSMQAEKAIAASGQSDSIVEISALSTRLPLHVVTPKNNPVGRPYIAFINNGFWEVIQTGQWFPIAAKHIKSFREGLQ